MTASGLTEGELRAALLARGVKPPSRRRLRRLREARLSEMVPGNPSGVRGRPPLLYAHSTVDRLEAISRIGGDRKVALPELGFQLWWEGHGIDLDIVRDFAGARLDADAAETRALALEHDDPSDFADAVQHRFPTNKHPRDPDTRLRLSRLRDVEDLRSFIWWLAALDHGGAPNLEHADEIDTDERTPREILNAGLGISPAANESSVTAPSWIDDTARASEFIQQLAKHNQHALSEPGRVLYTASDDQLIEARKFGHALEEFARGAAQIEQVNGRDAFGLGELALLNRSADTAMTRVRILRTAVVLLELLTPEDRSAFTSPIRERNQAFAAAEQLTQGQKLELRDIIREEVKRSTSQ